MTTVDSEINDCTWNSTSTKFLVGCKNGVVYEITKPEKNKIDTKESFEVELNMRMWKIKMMEFQMKKNQKKDEAELEKIKRMRLRGELPMEEEEEEDEDWEPEPILTIRYTSDSPDRFIITATGLYVGYYYICSFDNERPLKAVDMPKNINCTYFDYSLSRDFIVAGLQNGSYLIWSSENTSKYMEIKMHDSHTGAVNAAKFNMKENYMISVGADGLMNLQNINKEAIKMYAQSMVPGEDVTFVAEMDGFETLETEVTLKARSDESEDISDPEALSIQEQKLRTEEYWRMKKAEERKADIKNKVNLLREEFEKLRKVNESEDDWIQLSGQDFNIDPEYFKMLQSELEEKRDITHKEVAWGIEYRKIALEKIQNTFFGSLEYSRFTVKAIKADSFVSTFRVKKMSDLLEENVRRFKEMIEKEYQPQSGSDDDLQSEGSSQRDDDLKFDKTMNKSKKKMNQMQSQNQQNKKKKTEAELKREERTRSRKERKEELEKHEKEEGKRNIDDPEDRKILDDAENTFGDYKLKMQKDYIVPEKERVNAEKKRQQMILLENSIFNLKSDFNKKLEELKFSRKTSIIELCKEKNKRLDEINKDLGVKEELFYPSIDEKLEYPENHYKINMEDIIKFTHKKAKESKVAVKTSMFGGKKDENVVSQEQKLAQEFEKIYREEQKKQNVAVKEDKQPTMIVRPQRQPAHDTETDIEMRKIKQIELEYEKEQITAIITNAIQSFDSEITELQKEKYRLESDLKQAEMKLITFFEELIILNSMESRDKELTKSLAECRKQKGKMLKDINDINNELKDKNSSIQEIKEKEDEYLEKFHTFCPPGSPLYSEIYTYYSKIMKIKSNNRAEGNEDGDGDMDDEDEDIDEEEDDEDNEASYKFNQEEHKIDDIDRLRESRSELYVKRQQIEDEIQKLQHNLNRLHKNQEGIKRSLDSTEKDIQRFQKFKMSKLNQLMISIVLKISQVQNLEKDEEAYAKWEKYREEHNEEDIEALDASAMNGTGSPTKGNETRKNRGLNVNNTFGQEHAEIAEDWRGYFLPQELQDSTLFTHDGLHQLLDRKRELDQHIAMNHENYRKKIIERRSIKKLIEEHEKEKKQKLEEYNEKQMLRFGSLIDLDSLEVSGPSQLVIDLRNKLSRVEKDCMRRREDADGDLEQTQRELTVSVKENTGLLDLIIHLGQEQIKLNDMLDETKQAVLEDENADQNKKIIRDKQELREVLQLQARKIETLKTEINLYKRKGGHIYTKVTTNRRNANLNQNE